MYWPFVIFLKAEFVPDCWQIWAKEAQIQVAPGCEAVYIGTFRCDMHISKLSEFATAASAVVQVSVSWSVW